MRLKEYLTFTKRERRGILALSFILIVVCGLSYWFRRPQLERKDTVGIARESNSGFQPFPGNTTDTAYHDDYYEEERPSTTSPDGSPSGGTGAEGASPRGFSRNPNEIDGDGGRSLSSDGPSKPSHGDRQSPDGGERDEYIDRERSSTGQRPFTTSGPARWRSGFIRKPNYNSDGHAAWDADKPGSAARSLYSEHGHRPGLPAWSGFRDRTRYDRLREHPLEINSADTSAFIALPGIGSKLAGRIVAYRRSLGGFERVEQLSKVYGLQDSVFQMLRPMLRCDPSIRDGTFTGRALH